MKKTVTFDKTVNFPTMIGEISAISLEKDLKFTDGFNVCGDLLLNGKYKLTEASRIEEDFSFKIPIEVALLEEVDDNTGTIDISDFSYDLDNTEEMICHIELTIEAVDVDKTDKVDEKNIEELRECDGDDLDTIDVEIPTIDEAKEEKIVEEKEEIVDEKEEIVEEKEKIVEEQTEENNNFLINNLDDSETYGTFIVYNVRQNETINSIIEKYHTSLEEIGKYNEIKEISVGTKLIIPYVND